MGAKRWAIEVVKVGTGEVVRRIEAFRDGRPFGLATDPYLYAHVQRLKIGDVRRGRVARVVKIEG